MKILAWAHTVAARFFHPAQNAEELEAEIRSHIAHRADDLERAGMNRAEAERRAQVEFGGKVKFREECYEALGGHFIETFVQDVRLSLRGLRKSPGFVGIAEEGKYASLTENPQPAMFLPILQ